MAKIVVYRKDTGAKVRIPEHWLKHPQLGQPFSKTPSQRARENQASNEGAQSGEAPARQKEK